MRILTGSGVVALSPDGEHVVVKHEVIEFDTPYIVKVAVLKDDFEAVQKDSLRIHEGFTPMDNEVIKYVFERKS